MEKPNKGTSPKYYNKKKNYNNNNDSEQTDTGILDRGKFGFV